MRCFSEWFIGHSGSTYWTKKDSEKAEIFRKIESYLTFLNVHQPSHYLSLMMTGYLQNWLWFRHTVHYIGQSSHLRPAY